MVTWRTYIDENDDLVLVDPLNVHHHLTAAQAWDVGDDLHWGAREIWDRTSAEVAKDAEGENGDGQAVPSVDDPVAVAEPVTQAEDHSDDVQDQGKHDS